MIRSFLQNLSKFFVLFLALALNSGRLANAAPHTAGIPLFRNPVVPGAVISGFFDHNSADGYVTFYDGRHNNTPAYGFQFTCSSPYMNDFVGCEDNVNGVSACAQSRQLWYDNHHGTDYEYATNWYTGATCDPTRFNGITHPVYAPAKGKVVRAGEDPNRANGWSILMNFDANQDGNYENDHIRAYFLHFTPYQIAVSAGQIVEEGQYLGLGGSSGYSSSPHLHFEVQRSADGYNWWPVDPYGWQGAGSDPWSYPNTNLWKAPVLENPSAYIYLPAIRKDYACPQGCELLKNASFESGHQVWGENGVQVIASTADLNLLIQPYAGSWLAWLGGRFSAADMLYQDVFIPFDTASARLVYHLYVDAPFNGNDSMVINLRDTHNKFLQQVDKVEQNFSPTRTWVERSINIPDLTAWRGQTLRLSFEATTTSVTRTSYYLDDLSFWVMP